ncbi:hypothetical protein [Dictyobacter kobayashii]|uniref:Uncharacterized protein n=1 Tax=Dictyobacter kobayashii TaxID=2014872 RepID=A0A402AKT3_9CHLR|nr:hypothetical protein [Dictyobacter kobayashii]GCE19634.1 hypothetical protein KDK_34340 [Dictyobacter kobayashii]
MNTFNPNAYDWGFFMTTTGELRSIIEELELVDAGDADSYLGEDTSDAEETPDMVASNLARCLRYIASADERNYQLC